MEKIESSAKYLNSVMPLLFDTLRNFGRYQIHLYVTFVN